MSDDRRPHRRVTHRTGGPTRTKQADSGAADANKLVRKWLHGEPVFGTAKQPSYGDFSDATSFHESLNRVHEAQAAFDALPAPVRRMSDNDPGKFLDLVHTPEGRKILEEVGMLPQAAPETAPDPPGSGDQLPLDPTPPDNPGASS